jgi:predicted nucleotidyltransferase component of viral defense system
VSAKQLKDVAASVRQRLYDLAKERGEDFQLILIHYALERLLYRLSRSLYRDQFVLKGAMLLTVWGDMPYRATRDLDLLGRGDNGVKDLQAAFREICQTPVEDDGLEFLIDSIHGEEIAEDQEYQGVRLSFAARLAVAKIPIQVDIGFGDTVQPEAESLAYPTMLNFPAPTLLSYPREVVIAEKYQAMVLLGMANSRMKDFYDISYLARHFDFDGIRLCEAIRATFDRRNTPLPSEKPLPLTKEFSEDRAKMTQWGAFLNKTGVGENRVLLSEVIALLQAFLWPPTLALVERRTFEHLWRAGGPWRESKKRS